MTASQVWATRVEALEVPVPLGFDPADVALIANGSLSVNDRVRVQHHSGGWGAVANRGYFTVIGADARVGSVFSTGSVLLRDRAFVGGDLSTTAPALMQNASTIQIVGTVDADAAAADRWYALPWAPAYPNLTARDDVLLFRDQSRTLPPGEYRNVVVYSGGNLRLQAGVYHFRDFILEPEATLRFTTGAEAVEVTVHNAFIDRGTIIDEGYQQDRVGFVVNCTGPYWFHVEAPFVGTIVAPTGNLILSSRVHRGQFIAKNIEVHQEALVVLAPAYRPPLEVSVDVAPSMVSGGSGTLEDPYLVTRDNPELYGTVELRPGARVEGGGCQAEGSNGYCAWDWTVDGSRESARLILDEWVVNDDETWSDRGGGRQLLPVVPDSNSPVSWSGPGTVPWRTRGGSLRRQDAAYSVTLLASGGPELPPWRAGALAQRWLRLDPRVRTVPVFVVRPMNEFIEPARDFREAARQLLDFIPPYAAHDGQVDGRLLSSIIAGPYAFAPISQFKGSLLWAPDVEEAAVDDIYAQCLGDPAAPGAEAQVAQFQVVGVMDYSSPEFSNRRVNLDWCDSRIGSLGTSADLDNIIAAQGGSQALVDFVQSGATTDGYEVIWTVPADCNFQGGWVGRNNSNSGSAEVFEDRLYGFFNTTAHELGHEYLSVSTHSTVRGELMSTDGVGTLIRPEQCVALGAKLNNVDSDTWYPELLQIVAAAPAGWCQILPQAGSLGVGIWEPISNAVACALRDGSFQFPSDYVAPAPTPVFPVTVTTPQEQRCCGSRSADGASSVYQWRQVCVADEWIADSEEYCAYEPR